MLAVGAALRRDVATELSRKSSCAVKPLLPLRRHSQISRSFTTFPCTSVTRNSRPLAEREPLVIETEQVDAMVRRMCAGKST